MPPAHANTAAVVPCLNEARAIGRLVQALLPHVRLVLVIDDGSTDRTGANASDAGASVITHPRPMGKGAALASGWTAAGTHPGIEWVLMLDGDGQHAPEDAPAFLATAQATGADLVIGNRMPGANAMPWVRRVTNRWMSRRISGLARTSVPDSQCGFRLARLAPLLQLGLRSQRFEIESEMIVAFAHAGLRIESVPIQVRYGLERSKISPLRDTLRWLRWYTATPRSPRS